MCGRYVLTTPGEVLAQIFDASPPAEEVLSELVPRYNIAPTQRVPIIRPTAGPRSGRELAMVRWGLIPHWAKEAAIGNKLINARAETVAEKPSFRDSLQHRRCLIPANAYFEWQKLGKGKQPWLFRLRDGQPFALAGLWSSWRRPENGDSVETCTILTTTPNDLAASVHDRMPVILSAMNASRWLEAAPATIPFAELFTPFPATEMASHPVSSWVNSPAHDTPECIAPVAAA